MTVALRGGAEADLEEALDHYVAVRLGRGGDFLDEFRRAVGHVLQYPNGWQSLDADYRRCRFRRFPYGIIYRVDVPTDQLIIVAIQQLNRRPNSWLERRDP